MDTKTRPIYIYCLQETYLRSKDAHRLKVRGWERIFHANGNRKKVGMAGIAFLRLEKIDFKTYNKCFCGEKQELCQWIGKEYDMKTRFSLGDHL